MQIPIKRAIERVPGGMMAVPLGSGLDLAKVWQARLLGIGIAGVAAASTADSAAAVPAIVAAANPAEAAAHATILAAAVIITTVLVPLLTAWTARAVGARPAATPAPAE